MKNLRLNIMKIFAALCELAVGIVLFINPVGFTSGIIMIIGIIFVILGVINVINYFRSKPEIAALHSNLSRGLMFIAGGLFCFFKSNWFIATFPILTILYGIAGILAGILKIQWTVDMLRLGRKYWFFGGISALFTLVFAVIILVNPFKTTEMIWSVTAVSLIVGAVLDFVYMALGGSKKVVDMPAEIIDANVTNQGGEI